MASVNKVILVGNLGADPELRYTPSGDAVCNIRLATTESWKDKNTGEKREITEWHRVVFYRKLAEVADQYLRKGSQVYLEGRIKTRKWQDKDGQDRYTTEIEATEMQMLGNRQAGGEQRQPSGGGGGGGSDADYRAARDGRQPANKPKPQGGGRPEPAYDELSDDIPFAYSDAYFDEQSPIDRRMRRYG